MASEMKKRQLVGVLREQGYSLVNNSGNHEKWACPCGQRHLAIVPRHPTISAGVIRDIVRKNPCRPEGWLK